MGARRIPKGKFPDWKATRERVLAQTGTYEAYAKDHPGSSLFVPTSYVRDLAKVLEWDGGYTLFLEELVKAQEEDGGLGG